MTPVLLTVGWSVESEVLEMLYVLLLLKLEYRVAVDCGWLYIGMGETDWLYNVTEGTEF